MIPVHGMASENGNPQHGKALIFFVAVVLIIKALLK